jgi:hypothetical protein
MDLTFQLAIERGLLLCFFFRAFWLIQDVSGNLGEMPKGKDLKRKSANH